MKNINWREKLASKKFWAALGIFVSALLVLFGVSDLTIERVGVAIASFGGLVIYILVEGAVDIARSKNDTENTEIEPPKDENKTEE